MDWWLWLLLGLALLLVELVTPGGFYFLFFGVGAIVTGVLAGLGLAGQPWLQWLLFTGFSLAGLLLFRKPLVERTRAKNPAGDVDSLVGEAAVALADIGVNAIGKAELRGAAWSARNVGDTIVLSGQRCRVEQVDGLMLFIRG